jgi:hypothetical protein
MNRFTRLAGLLALLAAAACGNDSARSLLPVDLTADAEVGTIANVDVTVSRGVDPVVTKHIAWNAPAGQPLKLGIYLPHTVDGTVNVQALALDGNGAITGASDAVPAVIHAGKQADVVALHITPRTSVAPDGGAPDSGGGDGPDVDGAHIDGAPPADGPDAAPVDTAPTPDVQLDMGADRAPDSGSAPSFHPPENLEPTDLVSRSYSPEVAVDGKGNVLVAWREDSQVKTRRWDATAKTWGDTKAVESMGYIDTITLKMTSAGHATLLWRQTPSDDTSPIRGVWASNSKDGGLTWTPPKQVRAGASYGELALAVAHDGSARVAWQETVMNYRQLWAARYDDATGLWSDVAMVKPGMDYEDRRPRLVMDDAGGGLLVWRQDDDMMQMSTWGTSFVAQGPLKTPQLLDDLTTDYTYDPVVAITPDGSKGVAIWSQSSASGAVFYSDFTPGGGFQAPKRAIVDALFGWPVIVMDQTGTATLAYFQTLTQGAANVVAVRRAWGQAWDQVTPLEMVDQVKLGTDDAPIPDIGIDGNGDVHVAWNRKVKATEANTYSIVTRRWSMGAWQPEQTVFLKDKIQAGFPAVGVGAGGQAAIVFTYWDPAMVDPATFSVFAALFP